MSGQHAEGTDDVCCAEVDDTKLKDCDNCDLVLCGSDKCREEHREQHNEKCKREAVLNDDDLFTQPDISHLGECPLCFLPMPLDNKNSIFWACCSKTICDGCRYADYRSNGGGRSCPFCRDLVVDDDEYKKRMMKRIKAGDPAAMCQMGTRSFYEGDYDSAIKYWTKAAEFGDVLAHHQLGCTHYNGEGSVEEDEEKAVYYWEKAAIGGHPKARHMLGCVEKENGNVERAVKHFIIAANLGFEDSMKVLWGHYSKGNITKEELEVTLRSHKDAIDTMKSPEREAAEAWRRRQRGARRRN